MQILKHAALTFFCACLLAFGAIGCDKNAEAPPKQPVKQKIPAAKQAPKDQAKAEKKTEADVLKPADQQQQNKDDAAAAPSTSPLESDKVVVQSESSESGMDTMDAGSDAGDKEPGLVSTEGETADTPAASAEEVLELADLEEAGASAEDIPVALAEEPELQFDIDFGGEEDEAASAPEEAAEYNPFAPLFRKKKAMLQQEGGLSDDARGNRPFLTPLEQIGLGQISLEGIIMAESGNRAIVTDASGKGYVLKKGTYVGLNSGRVEKITGDRVEIVEIIGGRRTVTKLELQKSAGE